MGEIVLLAHYPYYVAFLKLAVGSHRRQVFLAFLNTYNHTVVATADATLAQCHSYERTTSRHNHLPQAHRLSLNIGVTAIYLSAQSLGKS